MFNNLEVEQMKILCLPPVKNIFFAKLCEGLRRFVSEVSCDMDMLWDTKSFYDILHIHFPEAFYCWKQAKTSEDETSRAKNFLERLNTLKQKGVKILWTVHNLEPHDRAWQAIGLSF